MGHGGVTEGQSSGTWRGLQRGRVVKHGGVTEGQSSGTRRGYRGAE